MLNEFHLKIIVALICSVPFVAIATLCLCIKMRREIAELKRIVGRKPPEEKLPVISEPESVVPVVAQSKPVVRVETPKKEAMVEAPERPFIPPVIGDWFFVRGAFAPKGVTREYAVATRWLLRVGSVLIVGAMAYFMTLAINRGWIGPKQRVFGMIFWGTVGVVGGTWIKIKCERYRVLGEVFAALGLVGLYLGFGLGHRYFTPPVIGSMWVALAGLIAVTVAAGVLSVRLRSLFIAVLGLLGGFVAPMVCSFQTMQTQLSVYVLLIAIGATVVAYLRNWIALGYCGIAGAFLLAIACGVYESAFINPWVGYPFHLALYALVIALTVTGAWRLPISQKAGCWAFVALAAFCWNVGALGQGTLYADGLGLTKLHFAFAAVIHAALAYACRRRRWEGAAVLTTLSALCAGAMLVTFCQDSKTWQDHMVLVFCAYAALLADLSWRTRESTLGVLARILSVICVLIWFRHVGLAYDSISVYWDGFAGRILEGLSLPLLGLVLAWRLPEGNGKPDGFRVTYIIASGVIAFFVVSAECHWFGKLILPSVGTGCMTIFWSVIAAGFLSFGILRRFKAFRHAGLVLIGAAAVKVVLLDTATLATPARVTVLAAVGALMIAGAFLYLKFKSRFEK